MNEYLPAAAAYALAKGCHHTLSVLHTMAQREETDENGDIVLPGCKINADYLDRALSELASVHTWVANILEVIEDENNGDLL